MRAKSLLIAAALVLLSSSLPAASAQMTPAFGPKQYTRTAGPPQTFTEHFHHCGTAACQIVIVNGNADGSNRVSSASISLNGVEIRPLRSLRPAGDIVSKRSVAQGAITRYA